MNIGDKVRFTKIETFLKESDFDILPLFYTNEGVLLMKIRIGDGIFMARSKRNGIEIPGIFKTSAVKKIEGELIYTTNSVWKIEILEKERV